MRINEQNSCPSFASLCIQRNDVSRRQNRIMGGIVYKLAERAKPKQKNHIDKLDKKGFDIYLTKGKSEDSVNVILRKKEGDDKPIYCGTYFSWKEFDAQKVQKKANNICQKDSIKKFLSNIVIVSATMSAVKYIYNIRTNFGQILLKMPRL